MQEAYAREPERFIQGVLKVPMPPKEVWINKPDYPESAQKIMANNARPQSRNFVPKRD